MCGIHVAIYAVHSIAERAKIQVFIIIFFFSFVCTFSTEIIKLYSWITFCYFLTPINIFSDFLCDRMRFAKEKKKEHTICDRQKKTHTQKQVFIDRAVASSPPEIGNLILWNWWQCIKNTAVANAIERMSVCVVVVIYIFFSLHIFVRE